MAGKESQSPIPLVTAAVGSSYSRNDEETRRKKRIKYLLYFVAFVIFQTAVIAIFTLTIMKVRTPRFRVRSGTFDTFNSNDAGTPFFEGTMNAQLSVKNANFGKYKYQDTPMLLFYGEIQVGDVLIPGSSVGWRSTKKINVRVNLNSTNVPSNSPLGSDLSIGFLKIRSHADMRGKVKLTFIFNKKKSTKMDCIMDIAIRTKQLVNISCQ